MGPTSETSGDMTRPSLERSDLVNPSHQYQGLGLLRFKSSVSYSSKNATAQLFI
jgi:hypothetical protein